METPAHDQALVNQLILQRDRANNNTATALARLDVVTVALEIAVERIAELETPAEPPKGKDNE